MDLIELGKVVKKQIAKIALKELLERQKAGEMWELKELANQKLLPYNCILIGKMGAILNERVM